MELLLFQILCSHSSIAEDSGILGNAVYLAKGFTTLWAGSCVLAGMSVAWARVAG